MKKLMSFALAGLMALSLAACGSSEENKQITVPIYEAKAVSFKTVKAEVKEISQRYFIEGKYASPYKEKVKFEVSGQIDEVFVAGTQSLKKGDLLCTIFSDDLDKRIEDKEVYLKQAKKTLNTLWANGGSYYEVQQAQVEVDIQQLEYDHLVAEKEKYKVYAPCDGDFTLNRQFGGSLKRYIWVNQGTILGTVSDNSEKYLVCTSFQKLNKVNFGTRVDLTQGELKAQGMVVDIISEGNGDYTQFLYVIKPDEGNELFDFGEVQASFNIYSRDDVVVVPTKAIKKVGNRQFVNLLIDNVKVEQDVETGIVDGDMTEITGGLIGGEDLILN